MTAAMFFKVMASSSVWAGPSLYSRMGCVVRAYYYLAGAPQPGAGLLRPRQVANGLVRLPLRVGRGHSCILRPVAGDYEWCFY